MDADNAESDQGKLKRARMVVGVDGSAPSMEALRWAAADARLLDAILEVVHARFTRKVVSDLIEGAEEEEESILDRAVAQARELEPTIEIGRASCRERV